MTPLEAQHLNSQTVPQPAATPSQTAYDTGTGRQDALLAFKSVGDRKEQKENIVGPQQDFEAAAKATNTKGGLGQKFKMAGLEIEIPASPREDCKAPARDSNALAATLSSSRKSASHFSPTQIVNDKRHTLYSPNAKS